jgi:ACS family hexuronate transporter-like MFS transporter
MAESFQLAGAFGSLAAGWFIDRMGIKRGFALGVGTWSVAAMAHAVATSVGAFFGARVVLGLAEATGTPAVVKTAAAYFEPAERTRVLGISNMAPSLGAVTAPLLIPPVAVVFGWRATFLAAGGLGLLWVFGWLALRIAPARSAAAEAAVEPVRPRLLRLLAERRTWALVLAKSLADLVWWFSIFFMPDLFHRLFHLSQGRLGLPVAAVYAMAAAGSFSGGWIHGALMRAGMGPAKARKGTILGFALVLLVAPLVLVLRDPWSATAVLGVVLFACQGVSTNIFGGSTDLFPPGAVGSAIGLATFVGNIAGVGMSWVSAWCLQNGYGYGPMLAIVAVAPLLALLVIQLLAPKLDEARLED